MNILLCPDKFKGSISAQDVCASLESGLLMSGSEHKITCIPMADGGDGTIAIIKDRLNLKSKSVQTVDPLGRSMVAEYHFADEGAFIELASASGLALLAEHKRNPMYTTTEGTGILIRDAIDNGYKSIYLFIGGSATNDGGTGIAHALGFQFLDNNLKPINPIGENLKNITAISDRSTIDFSGIKITIFCDVTNPMTGPNGAARVYARQKGADDSDIEILEAGMNHLNDVFKDYTGKDWSNQSGMGAAGGVAASLVYLMDAQLKNGFRMLSELMHLEEAIKNADLVITGEGKIDKTSFQGKVVGNVLSLCGKYQVPCGLVGGVIDELPNLDHGIQFQKSILELAESTHDAMHHPQVYLRMIGERISLGLKNQ
jgi:glycerate kinase